MARPELEREIKQMIIDVLQIPDVEPDAIDSHMSIFENPLLELDSIDSVELVVALQRRYGVHIDDQNLARVILRSVETIADFIEANG